MKKKRIHVRMAYSIPLIILLVVSSASLAGMQFGAYVGTLNEAGTTLLGLSLDSGFLIPMLKLETEFYFFTAPERTGKVLTAGLKLRPKFGKISPYAVVGVGTELQRLDLSMAKDRYFTFVGGGMSIKVAPMLSIRLDARFQQHGKSLTKTPMLEAVNFTRFSAGVFVSI